VIERALRKLATGNGLMDLALAIVLAEELAEETAERVREKVSVAMAVVPTVQVTPSTEVVDHADVRLPATYDIKCPATVREAVIVSSKPDVLIDLAVDGVSVLYEDFRSLSKISQYSEWIDAIENNGVYVIRLSDISCKERLSLVVNALNEDVRVERVLFKIDRLHKDIGTTGT
jgi:hypothetical protein